MTTKEELLRDITNKEINATSDTLGVQEAMEKVKSSFIKKVSDSKGLGGTLSEIIFEELSQEKGVAISDIILSLGHTLSDCAKSCCDTEEDFRLHEKRATEVVSNKFLPTIQPTYITDPDDLFKLVIDESMPFDEKDFHPARFMLYCSNLINYFAFHTVRSSIGRKN